MPPGGSFGRNDNRRSRWGLALAIAVSAIGHAGLFYLAFFILPGLLTQPKPPANYTVKIVDQLPAGDLGTHLPRLAGRPREQSRDEPKPENTPPPPAPPLEEDENAVALNVTSPTVTPTPTPTPTPTATATPTATPTPTTEPTVEQTPEPTATPTATPTITPTRTPKPTPKRTPRPTPKPRPTPEPTPRRRHHPPPVVVRPTPTPTPNGVRHHRPLPTPSTAVAIAKAEATPNVDQRLADLRKELMAEHLKSLKQKAEAQGEEANGRASRSREGGPAVADVERSGKGYGLGSGSSGSQGVQQDAAFLLYYQTVQKRIKQAWNFAGNNPELSATVSFGINPDGSLNAIKVYDSSRDPAFDDSVVRAIRRAAPFPPPPLRYREQFAAGVEAVFKLGDLSS